MAGTNRYTADQVIAAIRAARGIKATAAGNLKCSRQTIDNYIARDPAIAAAYREAHDTLLGEDVAIKELIPALVGDEVILRRFLAEAKATMRLTHKRKPGFFPDHKVRRPRQRQPNLQNTASCPAARHGVYWRAKSQVAHWPMTETIA